jgi:two-component system, LytTR family, sensor kinase
VSATATPRAATIGAFKLLLFALAASPVFAFIEASQDFGLSRLEGRSIGFFLSWTRFLLPAATLALCTVAIVPLVRRFPLPQPRPLGAIAAHVAAGAAFPLLHLGLLDLAHITLLDVPFGFIEHLMWMLVQAYLSDFLLFCAIAATLHAVRHVRAQSALREESLRLRAALADARLAALAQQIRPHFLFNTLNAAAMLVRTGEPAKAVEVLARLSGLIREVLRDHSSELVPLTEEFAFLREYLLLEGVRFGDRLHVTLELAPDAGAVAVPFLILQPLVENAVRYGIAARSGRSELHVSAAMDDGVLRLLVRERGHGGRVGEPEHGQGLGLANTRERLRARYGDRASVTLTVDPHGLGSRAEVCLEPLDATMRVAIAS